jgi:hypothetical protein
MTRSLILVALIAPLLLPACAHVERRVAVVTSGFAGTWQLNREKSDIPPVTKSQVLTIETDGVRVAMRETLVNEKGEKLTIAVEGRFDGLDYPVTGTPFADTVSYLLLAPHIIEGVAKKAGVVVVKETAILAADGLSVTVTYVSFDAEGHSFTNLGVFERVHQR